MQEEQHRAGLGPCGSAQTSVLSASQGTCVRACAGWQQGPVVADQQMRA